MGDPELGAKRARDVAVRREARRERELVHVDSTYETRVGRREPLRRDRGFNRLELYDDGARWWIASAMGQSETAAHPIPPALLPRYAIPSYQAAAQGVNAELIALGVPRPPGP